MSTGTLSGRSTAVDLTEMHGLSSAKAVVEEGSTLCRFTVYVLLPIQHILTDYSVDGLRGVSPIQDGGRFLFYDTVKLGDEQIGVMLTLHEGSSEGAYRIAGELFARVLPPYIIACLSVGPSCYEAVTTQGKVEFNNVVFPPDLKGIQVKLATPDEGAGEAGSPQ